MIHGWSDCISHHLSTLSTILQHFTHNETQWPTAVRRWHLLTPSYLQVWPEWPYCWQAQSGCCFTVKWSIADLHSSSNNSLPFAWITGPRKRNQLFRTLIFSFYSLVFLSHFLRMLRLVVFSSKTKSYQEQKTREIAMAKPAKVILNKSCVELCISNIAMYNI